MPLIGLLYLSYRSGSRLEQTRKKHDMTNILEKLTRSYALLFAVAIAIPSVLRIVEAV